MRRIIFVGGIHGVGKTWVCQRLESTMSISHFTDSQLIRKLKDEKPNNTDKSVKNINSNQDILLNAIEKYIHPDRLTLLDGHFCLLNSDHEVERIPMETFKRIAPCTIIVLFDTIKNISKRISGRDGISYDYDFLSYFQDKEIKYANKIAEHSGVPYLKFDVAEGVDSMVNFIDKLQLGKDKK